MTLTGYTVIGMYLVAATMIFVTMLLRAKTVDGEDIPALPFGKVPVWFFHKKDLLGFWGIAMFFFLLVVSNELFAGDREVKFDVGSMVVAIGMQLFITAVAVAMVIRRVKMTEWLGLSSKQWPLIIGVAPGVVVLMWILFAFIQAAGYTEWLKSMGVGDMQDTVKVLISEKDMVVLVLMIFTAVIVAPICEEIVFRGYLYGSVKKFVGPWVAGLATGLIFSAVHGNMMSMLPLFVFGVALAWLYEFTGTIWAPMLVHLLFNSATVALQMLIRFGVINIPLES